MKEIICTIFLCFSISFLLIYIIIGAILEGGNPTNYNEVLIQTEENTNVTK